MEKGGRRRDEVWERVTLLEREPKRWKCNDCGEEFAGGASRIKAHLNKVKGIGIRPCTGKANSNNDTEHNLLHSQGQIQADDAEDQERTEDLQMMKRYVFECLRPEDKVIVSPLSYLTREEFITLEPEAYLDSLVIDAFVEILTDIERKKKTMPLNWYLPVTFSEAAKGKVSYFLNFVHCQKITENYMSDLESCDKIFIPVHVGARPNGHFYLYIIHLKSNEIEIWDSLPNTFEAEIEETTKKLLIAMEKLFEIVTFTKFHLKKANNIRLQPNGSDCGVFVINYMEQSDNYVKRDGSFEFESQKEREDLALKLLNNDLNKEKQNLYDKARRHYAQDEKQDGNKRLRVDPSKEHFEDVGREMEAEYDDFDEEYDDDEDDDGLENDLVGCEFQGHTEQIWKWIEDDNVSAIGVWGMAGSGKTALASHIYNKLLERGVIKVIWVTVSQNSIYKLQKVIARSIKLDISDEFEVKRIARKLFQAFKKMKKCVVILDDVWDHFFLKEVGFPMLDKQIKLILTTRIWEVCQGMGCKKNTVRMACLKGENGMTLIKKIMGFDERVPVMARLVAYGILEECGGIPLAIFRIVTSMKMKEQVREQSHMLECAKIFGYEMDKWVLPVLRSSYDFLTNKLQRFFLYCALNTNKNGYFNGHDVITRLVYESIDETQEFMVLYNEGHNMLDKLKNHSMLDRCDIYSCNMNKWFRALAINIVEDTCKIMANAYKELAEIPSDDQWKDDLQKVFLTGNMIETIPDGTCPRCSLLSALFLDGNIDLNYISDDFFNNMPALKTLDLSKTRIKCLPKSVSSLKCLNALLLSQCEELSYIPTLINLKWLILLDLSRTAITEAPLGLESLIKLKYLNLLHTPNLVISTLVISKLTNLEHLEFDVTTQVGIQGLKKLKVIVANFRDSSVFNKYMSFLAKHCVLRSYHITLGDSSYERIDTEYSMKRITFKNMNLINILPAIFPEDTNELFIKGCHQEIGASSLCRALSNGTKIERLDISSCKDVKSLSTLCPFCSSSKHVGHQPSLFSHLTHLKIFNCHSMETLMTPKLLALLQNLRTIDVNYCEKMKEIVGEDDHSKMELGGSGDLSHPTPITLPRLTSLELQNMTLLNFVYRGVMLCPSLQTFYAGRCKQLNLPRIEISNGCELPMEKISTGYRWEIKTD